MYFKKNIQRMDKEKYRILHLGADVDWILLDKLFKIYRLRLRKK